ncbi:MAG TPA: enoyl-CoA hydratase/isomerase family protein [Ilumatobacteraceae bacterium]|nr:enoyl-CoA hydratase/isomerase family protein [Ilumatobacteraceae bacterium]
MAESAIVVVDGPNDAGVATLTINRPGKKNALSIAVRDAMSDQLDRLTADAGLKVLVLTGSGSCFSAGFDLDEFAVDDPGIQDRLWASSDRFHHTLLRFPLPTIAAVNGAALAGGFDLALLCDIRVAGASAFFGHPEQAFGDVIYGLLHDLVGGAVARDLCLTGRRIDAAEAMRMGIVRDVVADDYLLGAVSRIADEIVRAPRSALIRTKAKAIARCGIAAGLPTLDF